MQTKVLFFLLLGVVTSSFCAFAHTNSRELDCTQRIEQLDIPQQPRIYIQADQIHVTVEGLFVEMEGNLYQVAQVSQDENGFYIPRAEFWVTCPNGHPNPPWRFTCQVCGLAL